MCFLRFKQFVFIFLNIVRYKGKGVELFNVKINQIGVREGEREIK